MAYVAIADRDVHGHDPETFFLKYIWSQDHKVIAIQYSIVAIFVGLVALVLSGLMRLQLGFPDQFHFIDPNQYYQFITMHGMIMVIYLLTALFLGEPPRHRDPVARKGAGELWASISGPFAEFFQRNGALLVLLKGRS